MSVREVIARAIEPDAFDQPPEFEPWAAQRRVSAYAKARKYLAALDAAGKAVVPKEPTQSMINAAVEYTSYAADRVYPEDCVNIYHAMLAAAKDATP
jgi:hypothetical protein